MLPLLRGRASIAAWTRKKSAVATTKVLLHVGTLESTSHELFSFIRWVLRSVQIFFMPISGAVWLVGKQKVHFVIIRNIMVINAML